MHPDSFKISALYKSFTYLRSAGIPNWGHSDLGAQPGCKNQPACVYCLWPWSWSWLWSRVAELGLGLKHVGLGLGLGTGNSGLGLEIWSWSCRWRSSLQDCTLVW